MQTPFPLYPGECLAGAERFGVLTSDYRSALKLLPVIPVNEAIRLEAVDDFTDGEVKRATGEQWQVNGPCVYIPTPNAVSFICTLVCVCQGSWGGVSGSLWCTG